MYVTLQFVSYYFVFLRQNSWVMIEKRILEEVVTEQQQELLDMASVRLCSRKEEQLIDLESNMAQCVIGVRRSGKSTLCYSMLRSQKVKFAYVNFDDERLESLKTEDLNPLLEVLYKIYGDFKYLFIDEIQNIKGWYLFVNRLLRAKMHIIITGSNANLLSGELATHLTGRHDEIELYPFSFRDFCNAKNVDVNTLTTKNEAFRRDAFDQYLKQGGFPELLYKKNKTGYVNTLVENILKRDIEQRHKIKYSRAFERLAQHLLNVAPTTIVSNDLAKLFEIKSSHTVDNYINYLAEAYLLIQLQRYSTKSKNKQYDTKVYPVDVALMDGREDAFVGDNLGWRLEALVYIELLRRNRLLERDIYYYKNSNGYEADFVVCKGNKVLEIYQVCYDISSDKARKRELRGLLTAAKETKCDNLFLITDFHRDTIQQEGKTVKIMPAYEWLLTD